MSQSTDEMWSRSSYISTQLDILFALPFIEILFNFYLTSLVKVRYYILTWISSWLILVRGSLIHKPIYSIKEPDKGDELEYWWDVKSIFQHFNLIGYTICFTIY